MIKKVIIAEISSKQIIAEYPIDLDEDSEKEDYFEEAWKNAVDEGFVDESRRDDYTIRFSVKKN